MTPYGIRALPCFLPVAVSITIMLFTSDAALATARPPTTSIRAQEWWLDSMHAAETMWPISTGKGITIALIDSGVNANHPDLVGQILTGEDFSGLQGGADTDVDGHGTGMASLIAGTGKGWTGQGLYGLAPGVKILPLRIVAQGQNAASSTASFSRQLSAALRVAAESDAQIINISMVESEDNSSVRSAVNYALGKGKLIVAGAGNSGLSGNPIQYPAAFPGVVAVGATDRRGDVAAESEHGPQVVLTAPGTDFYEACVGPSGYCTGSGTSNSTALVSASAALLWSVHPAWTADQVIRVLINTADSGGKPGVRDPYYGYGLVRPRLALTDPGSPGPANVDPLLLASAATPSSAASTQSAQHADKQPGTDPGALIALGSVVALVVLGAVAAIRMIRRSKRTGP